MLCLSTVLLPMVVVTAWAVCIFFIFFSHFFFRSAGANIWELFVCADICFSPGVLFVCLFFCSSVLGGFGFCGEPRLNCSIVFRVGFCTQTSGDPVLCVCGVWCLMCADKFIFFFFFFFVKCWLAVLSRSHPPFIPFWKQNKKESSFIWQLLVPANG